MIGLRRLAPPVAVALVLTVVAGPLGPAARAHAPNPILGMGARWAQDQIVGYMWAPNGVPPAWAAQEIDAAAGDVARSRKSRAALFQRVADANSRIYYGVDVPCSSYGIACMNRTGVPDSFAGMWFRPHNWPFDWGQLKWCQAMAAFANGCYDVENVALDEFGHIELLGHHENFDDERDYLDSVVQFAARSRPRDGWNEHVFGRCDVARLQLEYELEQPSTAVSTCLKLASALTIAAPASVPSGGTARVSGTLRIAASTGARELSGDPLGARTVTLQRRPVGGSWSVVGTVPATPTAGGYALTITVNETADYRLVFAPSSEGLTGATSPTVRITATTSSCSGGSGRGAKPGPQQIPIDPC